MPHRVYGCDDDGTVAIDWMQIVVIVMGQTIVGGPEPISICPWDAYALQTL